MANEIAPVSSYFVGVDYNVWKQEKHAIALGGFIGNAELELDIGPNGLTFQENPVAEGITWGLQAQYRYDINQHWQIGTGITLGLGETDGEGSVAANDPIQLKITQFQHWDLTINYQF